MDKGRIADIKELAKARAHAPDKETIQNVNKAEKTIRDEQGSGYLKDQRKALVKAARTGRKGNIQDVQDTITRKKEKNMGIGKFAFSIEWPEGLYEKIYGSK